MRWLPVVDEHTAALITRIIVTYIRPLNRFQSRSLDCGTLELQLKSVSFRPVPKWQRARQRMRRDSFVEYQPHSALTCETADWTFRCHHCEHARKLYGRSNVSRRNLTQPVKCRGCGRNSPMRTWLCNCDVLWFTCNAHGLLTERNPP